MTPSLARRVTSEFLGTTFLVAAVVGSGIMAEWLAGGKIAITRLNGTRRFRKVTRLRAKLSGR